MDQKTSTESPVPNKKKRGRPTNASRVENMNLADFSLTSSIPRTVGVGVTGVPPQGSRVAVQKFYEVAQRLAGLIAQRLQASPPDIAEVDLKYRSPEIAVADAIAEVAARPDFLEMSAEHITNEIDIPNFEELQKKETVSELSSMEHIKFVRGAISKVRSKYVNYLARAIGQEQLPFSPVPGTELILSIAFYPALSTSVIQEFLVLSSQRLTDLKDVLYCVQDQATGDYSTTGSSDANGALNHASSSSASRDPNIDQDTPDQGPKSAPGYFFIEDTFYSDMRHGNTTDYAESTAQWINRGSSAYWSSLAPVKVERMEDSRFQDLIVQVGKKYLFCHRGHCEHMLVITDIRTLSERDDRNINSYPKQIYQAKYRQRRCTICDRTVAKWITSGDTFSVEDPSYYCQECFDMAHTNEDGSIRNTGFKILPYLHD